METKERIYQFSLNVIQFVEHIPKNLATDVLVKQLLRAATSIGTNVAEASAGASRRDFANHFQHALKSANETKYWRKLIRDSQQLNTCCKCYNSKI